MITKRRWTGIQTPWVQIRFSILTCLAGLSHRALLRLKIGFDNVIDVIGVKLVSKSFVTPLYFRYIVKFSKLVLLYWISLKIARDSIKIHVNQHLSHSAFQIFNDVSRDDIFCCFFQKYFLVSCPAWHAPKNRSYFWWWCLPCTHLLFAQSVLHYI